MVMLGGAGSILGPLIGATVYVLLKELVWVNFINFHSAILGVIIVAVIYLMPKGLLQTLLLRARLPTASRSARASQLK
jgi:branched-chain amino acid transport system permease protein